MLGNLVSIISQTLQPVMSKPVVPTSTTSKNPFANGGENVFLTNTSFTGSKNYGKNMPIQGGYFAGYYNDKPNIVGRKLFIEA